MSIEIKTDYNTDASRHAYLRLGGQITELQLFCNFNKLDDDHLTSQIKSVRSEISQVSCHLEFHSCFGHVSWLGWD